MLNPYCICAFMFNLLLLIAYFSKRRIQTIESKIYDVMVITSFIGTILGLLTALIINIKSMPFKILEYIPKIYLLYLIVWGTAFCLYVIAVSILKNKKNNYYNIIKYILITMSSIIAIFAIILPMKYIIKDNITYTSGLGVDLVYYLSFVYSIVMFVFIGLNFKNIKNRKYLPVLSFLILGIIIIIIQFNYPYLLLMTFLVTFNTVIMYFTIENPDVKVVEQINYLKTKAESDVKAKNKFLRNMSHEIATPINKAKGINSFNIDSVKSLEEVKKNAIMVDHILDELNEKSQSIINNIKLESGSVIINNDAYKVQDLFAGIKNIVIKDINFKEKKLKYKEKIDPNLPELLYGDSEKIKEVIMQLLSNAIKYTKEGTISLIVECNNSKKRCLLDIKVKDTGIGINEKNYKNLFKAFSRIDIDNNITINGLGLGLANAKLIIESLNGQIELVDSKVGKGSVFAVVLEQEILK